MNSDCSECNRLWNAYLDARRALAQWRREFDVARGHGDSPQAQAAARRAQEAADRNDESRARLAAHESEAHG
jgi:hypothetical protein